MPTKAKSSKASSSKKTSGNKTESQQGPNVFKMKGEDLVKHIKKIIKDGNAKKIIIRDEKGNSLLEIPVTIGVIGTLLLPVLAAVGALAAMVGWVTVEIVHKVTEKKK